ncbi:hypothetical protein CYMTET_35509, partial [Cymbomonas tetramitiformis]
EARSTLTLLILMRGLTGRREERSTWKSLALHGELKLSEVRHASVDLGIPNVVQTSLAMELFKWLGEEAGPSMKPLLTGLYEELHAAIWSRSHGQEVPFYTECASLRLQRDDAYESRDRVALNAGTAVYNKLMTKTHPAALYFNLWVLITRLCQLHGRVFKRLSLQSSTRWAQSQLRGCFQGWLLCSSRERLTTFRKHDNDLMDEVSKERAKRKEVTEAFHAMKMAAGMLAFPRKSVASLQLGTPEAAVDALGHCDPAAAGFLMNLAQSESAAAWICHMKPFPDRALSAADLLSMCGFQAAQCR